MKPFTIIGIILAVLLLGVYTVNSMDKKTEKPMMEMSKNTMTAVFAGGCFWCTESDFEKIDGVLAAVSGYTGGHDYSPTYENVSAGQTGHVEAVQVMYDPSQITYNKLPRKPKNVWNPLENLTNRLPRIFSRWAHFIRRKTITRTITRRNRSATIGIDPDPVGTGS